MAEMEEAKYDVLEKIGQGSFGIIRKVRNKKTNEVLCRKEISYHRMSDKERKQLAAEIEILQKLVHPNIVQYKSKEHIKSSADLHLYMEYCGNGDLGGLVKKLTKTNEYAKEDFVWTIFAQLICALYRCHNGENPKQPGSEDGLKCGGRQGKTGLVSKVGANIEVVLHRDLKPENVFLGENNAVKLGDFGLSKTIKQNQFASTYVGTPYYMPPEICTGEVYSHYADIWSVGCIIYELAARKVPFEARSHGELITKIRAGKIDPLPGQYSRELSETIAWCLRTNSRERPDSGQLLKVTSIKLARVRGQLTEERKAVMSLPQERDAALAKLAQGQKENQELRQEVQRLREQGKKVEMEWHTRATLLIDQKVHEQVELKKAELLKQFESAVEQRADEKLGLHLASLPINHGLDGGASQNVRSSTPPPGKAMGSFATTATTAATNTGRSSVGDGLDDSALETDLTSLSLQEEAEDQGSPLAHRTKPLKQRARKPLGRAQTYANCNNLNSMAMPSPIDVDMADPSPLPPMSIKGLSLSPRKNGQDRLSGGAGLRRNIFQTQQLRPTIAEDDAAGDTSGFADDDSELLDDDIDDMLPPESPSRPTSGLSNHPDPFKALNATKPKLPRPSLARQKTMPVGGNVAPRNLPARTNIFAPKAKSPEKTFAPNGGEKENRPPSSHARNNTTSAVPIVSISPSRKAAGALTPSRKAPPPPPGATGLSHFALARQAAAKNNANPLSPSKSQGRTLVQLQQARSQPNLAADDDEFELGMEGAPRLMPVGPMSPAKWDPVRDGEEMPSPFLAKRRQMVR